MINNNILKSLESNFQDPSYSTIISGFEQPEFCNKDRVKILIDQFSPNLEHIIENNFNIIEGLRELLIANNIDIPDELSYISRVNNCVRKTLIIDSALDFNTSDSMYISKLEGNIESDLEINTISRLVKGTVCNKNQKVFITQNDIPNNFNRSKFKVKDDKFIINIPKKIDTITVILAQCNTKKCEENNRIIEDCNTNPETFTEADIINNQIIIPIDISQYAYTFTLSYTIKESFMLKNIESITTPLKNGLELDFSYTYNELPAVILTIDEDKKVYSSYTTRFKTDINGLYNGVIIDFKGLKRQKTYGDINVTIIGAPKQKDDENVENG